MDPTLQCRTDRTFNPSLQRIRFYVFSATPINYIGDPFLQVTLAFSNMSAVANDPFDRRRSPVLSPTDSERTLSPKHLGQYFTSEEVDCEMRDLSNNAYGRWLAHYLGPAAVMNISGMTEQAHITKELRSAIQDLAPSEQVKIFNRWDLQEVSGGIFTWSQGKLAFVFFGRVGMGGPAKKTDVGFSFAWTWVIDMVWWQILFFQ